MILVKERQLKNGVKKNGIKKNGIKKNGFKNGFKKEIKRIYVNTLVPQFQFKNSKGEIVKPNFVCINL
jgi:hypothetical protein